MHQTKKSNQWYFGMNAHIGVDSRSKIIHAVVATAANVHDSVRLPGLLHGNETRVWGDAAYSSLVQRFLNTNDHWVYNVQTGFSIFYPEYFTDICTPYDSFL